MAQPNQPAKLAVGNQKGGVGKTTTAINIGGALNQRDRDVLLVDFDPQGNATEALGLMDAYNEDEPNLFTALTDPERRDVVHDLVREHDEMDVLPSNIYMTGAEPELTLSRRSSQHLSDLLDELGDSYDYDYVIVDCPPNLGNLMDNALLATQNVFIPALAESTSKRAFELFYDHVTAIERDFDIVIADRGVLVNRIDVRKNQAGEMVDWIQDAFDDVPIWRVRERADVQKSLEAGQSLLTFNPECDMCGVFEEIAADLDRQFNGGDVDE